MNHKNKSLRGPREPYKGQMWYSSCDRPTQATCVSGLFSFFLLSPHPDQPQRFHDPEVTRTERPRLEPSTLPNIHPVPHCLWPGFIEKLRVGLLESGSSHRQQRLSRELRTGSYQIYPTAKPVVLPWSQDSTRSGQ